MEEVNDLLHQLKEFPKQNRELVKNLHTNNSDKDNEITSENAEQFILESSSKLIQDSFKIIEDIKDMVYHEPSAENVTALSDLIKASTGAIDTLSRLVNQNKKSKTQIDIKNMDIESKKVLQSSDQEHSLKLSRGELLKQLLSAKEIIDVESKSIDDK